MSKITRPGYGGSAHAHGREHAPIRYIALQHVRVGDVLEPPGTLLTAEDLEGRNIRSMLQHRQIQQHIEPNDTTRSAP